MSHSTRDRSWHKQQQPRLELSPPTWRTRTSHTLSKNLHETTNVQGSAPQQQPRPKPTPQHQSHTLTHTAMPVLQTKLPQHPTPTPYPSALFGVEATGPGNTSQHRKKVSRRDKPVPCNDKDAPENPRFAPTPERATTTTTRPQRTTSPRGPTSSHPRVTTNDFLRRTHGRTDGRTQKRGWET